jgi:hypothetical protein
MRSKATSVKAEKAVKPPDCPIAILRDRFVFNTRTGAFFTTSREGAFILDAAWKGLTRSEIEKAVMDEFKVQAATAMSDTERFLLRLEEMSLLPLRAASAG